MLEEDGPAQLAGLWIDDVIVGFAGTPWRAWTTCTGPDAAPVGLPVTAAVLRDGRRVAAPVVPGEYPSPVRG
jgi:hypothetical protein